jgi:hypothetical protein
MKIERWSGTKQTIWSKRKYHPVWYPDNIIKTKEENYKLQGEDSTAILLNYVMLDELYEQYRDEFEDWYYLPRPGWNPSNNIKEVSWSQLVIEGRVVEERSRYSISRNDFVNWLKWKFGETEEEPIPEGDKL